MSMLFLEGLNLGVPLLEKNLKVATALADPGVTGDLGLQTGLNRLELLTLMEYVGWSDMKSALRYVEPAQHFGGLIRKLEGRFSHPD